MHLFDLLSLFLDIFVVLGVDHQLLFDFVGPFTRFRNEPSQLLHREIGPAHDQFQRRLVGDLLHSQLFEELQILFGRCQETLFHQSDPLVDQLLFAKHLRIGRLVDQTVGVPVAHQAKVGVVLSEHQAVFGPAREHPVGLFGPLGDQVVDQHADVGFVAPEDEGLFPFDRQGGVDTRHQSLGRRLLVAGGTVDLAGEVEVFDLFGLQCVLQFGRIDVVVLDGVAVTDDFRVLHPLHRADHRQLHVGGQGGAHAVDVVLRRLQRLGLDEDMVALLVSEAVDLVFDAGTVAGPHTFDLPGKERRAVEIAFDDAVGLLVGIGDVARQLFRTETLPVGPEAEGSGRFVTGLRLHFGKVDAAAVDARTGTGLEAPDVQAQLLEVFRQGRRSELPGPPRFPGHLADVDDASQKGSCR